MKRKLSALVDNHLDEHAAHALFDALRKDADLRQTWDTYCLIGDVLHKEKIGISTEFVAKVMSGIDEQPTLFAPTVRPLRRVEQTLWQRMLPIAASVMGFAAVGWVAGSLYADRSDTGGNALAVSASADTQGQIVPASVLTVTNVARGEQRNSQDQTYLFAHRSMTGVGGVQSVGDEVVAEVEGRQ